MKPDYISSAIDNLAEQIKEPQDFYTISGSIQKIGRMIHQGFVNDFDKNIVDAIYAVSESLDNLAKAVESEKIRPRQDNEK